HGYLTVRISITIQPFSSTYAEKPKPPDYYNSLRGPNNWLMSSFWTKARLGLPPALIQPAMWAPLMPFAACLPVPLWPRNGGIPPALSALTQARAAVLVVGEQVLSI